MKVTNPEILRPKINNIESLENDTLYQNIKNDPTTNSAIQCLTELLQRQEKQIQKLKEEHSLFINFQTKINGNVVFINVSAPFK